MRFRRRKAEGYAVIEHRVVECADATRGVVLGYRVHEGVRIQAELDGEMGQRGCLLPREYRRHETSDGPGVDDGVRDLSGTLRDQPTPYRIPLGPEILTL